MVRRSSPLFWQGVVAVILALSIGGTFAAVSTITALQGGPVTDAGAAFLDHLGSILAGALAGWLGGAAMGVAHARRVANEATALQDETPAVRGGPPSSSSTPDRETEGEV